MLLEELKNLEKHLLEKLNRYDANKTEVEKQLCSFYLNEMLKATEALRNEIETIRDFVFGFNGTEEEGREVGRDDDNRDLSSKRMRIERGESNPKKAVAACVVNKVLCAVIFVGLPLIMP